MTALTTRGIDAKLVSLHDVVAAAYGPDPQFHQAELYRLGPRFFHPLADEIARLILVCDARVPVVTGKHIFSTFDTAACKEPDCKDISRELLKRYYRISLEYWHVSKPSFTGSFWL